MRGMPLSVVILAAGQGKRMNSTCRKSCSRSPAGPCSAHVLDTARRTRTPTQLTSSTGTAASGCAMRFERSSVRWVLQAEQHGTGHAVAQAMPQIDDDARRARPVRRRAARTAARRWRPLIAPASGLEVDRLLSVMLDGPHRLRAASCATVPATVARIVEHNDANAKERAIREVNTGLMCVPASPAAWVARRAQERQRAAASTT